jgi:hypothetical protein
VNKNELSKGLLFVDAVLTGVQDPVETSTRCPPFRALEQSWQDRKPLKL